MSFANTEPVDQLNSFLRGEISAVETYRQAIEKLASGSSAAMLAQWQKSHEMRVSLLTSEIVKRGGQPAKGSGAWGAFAKLVEAGASVLGEKSAIAALEEGEDHGMKDYETDVAKLDEPTKAFILGKILPEQKRTHTGVRELKKQLG